MALKCHGRSGTRCVESFAEAKTRNRERRTEVKPFRRELRSACRQTSTPREFRYASLVRTSAIDVPLSGAIPARQKQGVVLHETYRTRVNPTPSSVIPDALLGIGSWGANLVRITSYRSLYERGTASPILAVRETGREHNVGGSAFCKYRCTKLTNRWRGV